MNHAKKLDYFQFNRTISQDCYLKDVSYEIAMQKFPIAFLHKTGAEYRAFDLLSDADYADPAIFHLLPHAEQPERSVLLLSLIHIYFF